DGADGGHRGLVAHQEHVPGGAGAELDAAVVGADQVPVGAEHRDGVALARVGGPARGDALAGLRVGVQVEHHVDVDLRLVGEVAGVSGGPVLAHGVGAHPAAVGRVDLQPAAVPVGVGAGIQHRARAHRGEVVAAGGGPGDDQLPPQVQDVRVGAEVLEVGAGEGEPHQGGAERAARGDGEVEGEHTRVL